jgi:hypothetical protein
MEHHGAVVSAQDIQVSILGQETGYPGWKSSWFLWVLSGDFSDKVR